ncbi:MAG: hypothetical protein M1830_005847 [Pleopsidium flavum]|nr:MAG: hypothetical protein M1830_005847 [Pleopsidium flavum]
MAAGTAAPSQPNGSVLSEKELREVLEYEKILQLRDDIFAGKHPLLKVSAHAATQIAPRSVQSPSTSTPRPINGETSTLCQPSMSIATRSNGSRGSVGQPNHSLQESPNAPRTSASGTGSSGIDPIFLIKSEDLVKAEIQLQRQRIERALEEQVYQRKIVSRQRISDQEAVPDFNISEVFAKALDIVKPISSAENNGANATATSSDSFDENTFYSSQVNDSPLEEIDNTRESPVREQQAPIIESNGVDANVHAKDGSGTLQQNGNLRSGAPEQDHCVSELEEHVYAILQQEDQAIQRGRSHYYTREPRDIHEEPDYSPPAADVAIPLRRNSWAARTNGGDFNNHQDSLRRSKAQVRNGNHDHAQLRHKPVSPSSPNVRIVRNHITSPLAPQPARVSPLAVAKVPQLPQDQRHRRQNHGARENENAWMAAGPSPEALPQQLNPRKRRRAPDAGERVRNVTARRGEKSPEPYIKPEPLSPPPFSSVLTVAPAPTRQRVPRPIHVDTVSPRDTHHEPLQPRRFQALSGPYRYAVESPISPAARRASSRIAHHGQGRDEPDLRRVASVQYVRHPQSPILDHTQYSTIEVQQPRQSSDAFIERQPAAEQYHYYRDPVPSQTGRYIRSERSLSPPPLRGAYTDVDQAPPTMAPPPPRRIVMDQYGNKYYEAPRTLNVRPSAAPSNRYADLEHAYERASVRQASKHAAPANLETYENARYRQRLAQSSPAPQRFVGQHHDDGTNHRAYRQLEYPEEMIVPRSGAGQVLEYPTPRHASHFEEASIPREPIPRMHSVRPINSRYEAAQEYAPRVHSVHPDQQGIVRLPRRQELGPARLRELSVRVDDDVREPGEYVDTDRMGYDYVPQVHSRRILDQGGPREVVMMDSPLSDDRRAVQRF